MLGLCSQLPAADTMGRYLISGIGKDPCKSFIDADKVGRSYYLTWLSGYITALNYHADKTYSIVNKESVDQLEIWLRNYCLANTDDTFEQAVKDLVRSLKNFRKKNLYGK